MNYEFKKVAARLVMPVLSLLPSVAIGQESIKQAFGEFHEFAKNQYVEFNENSSRQADPATGELIDQSTTIIFSVNEDGMAEKLIDGMQRAFNAESDKSYNEFTRHGSEMGSQPIIIGKENWIGSNPADSYIVMAFAEKKENQPPTHRTVYAFEWRKEDKGISGKLLSSYGPIPTSERKKKHYEDLQGLSDFSSEDYKATMSALDSIFGSKEMRGFILSLDSLATDSELMQAVTNLGNIFSTDKKVQTTSGWLNSFKQMCRSQMKYAKQGKSLTYFPTEILELCKESNNLTDEERQLCLKEIDRVIAVTKDEFDRDLLQQARKHLNR